MSAAPKKPGPYRRVEQILARYWKAYGGWRELVRSFYFHMAILVALISFPIWSKDPPASGPTWWDLALTVLPNLLGFTLGGYTLLVGFMGEQFRTAIAGPSEQSDGSQKESPFIEVNSTFVHFILVQILALIAAVVAKSLHTEPSLVPGFAGLFHLPVALVSKVVIGLWGIGFLLFSYALTLLIAALLAVFRVSTWIDRQAAKENKAAREAEEAKSADIDVDYVLKDMRAALHAVVKAEKLKAEQIKAEQVRVEQEAERIKAEQLRAEQELERIKAERIKAEQVSEAHKAEVATIEAEIEAMAAAEAEADARRQHKLTGPKGAGNSPGPTEPNE